MAIEWIGNTINSQLKEKYDISLDKAQNIRQILQNKNCDDTIVQDIIDGIENMVSKTLDTISESTERITNAIGCISPAAADTMRDLQNSYKNAINNGLDGILLDNYITQMAQFIDEAENKACQELLDILNNLVNSIHDAIQKLEDAVNSLLQTKQVDNELAQMIAKIASIINCINNELFHDDKMSQYIETVVPQLQEAVTYVTGAINNDPNADKTQLLKNATAKIADNIGLVDQYQDTISKINQII